MGMIAPEEAVITPVVKSFTVPLAPAQAFARFTRDIQHWWPLMTHSVYGEQAVSCAIEGHIGGRIYERHRDGRESVWGTVTSWEPPHGFSSSWHPGRTPETAQELEVRFEDEGGGTRVILTHRGWERLGGEGATTRANYDTGWDKVLSGFHSPADPALSSATGPVISPSES